MSSTGTPFANWTLGTSALNAPEIAKIAAENGTSTEDVVMKEYGPELVMPHPTFRNIFPNLPLESDSIIAWLARYPLEAMHPRDISGTVALWTVGDVACVTEDESLQSVYRKLIAEDISSLPVMGGAGQWLGLIDRIDLLFWLIFLFRSWRTSATDANRLSIESFSDFLADARFQTACVRDLLASLKRNRFLPVFQGFSLLHAFELIARTGVHRVPIISPSSELAGILTNSMVIRLLSQNLVRLGSLRMLPVASMLPVLSQRLITISETAIALEGFNALISANVDAIAIVDRAGNLLSALSASDTKGLGINGRELSLRLTAPLSQFKSIEFTEQPNTTPRMPLFVLPTDTLDTVILRMTESSIHQIFVCHQDTVTQTLGVTHIITQRDVLKIILMLVGLT